MKIQEKHLVPEDVIARRSISLNPYVSEMACGLHCGAYVVIPYNNRKKVDKIFGISRMGHKVSDRTIATYTYDINKTV